MIFKISKTIAIPDDDPRLAVQLAKAIKQGYDVQIMVDDKKIWRQVEREIKS
jgi:hypothetical protein